MLYLEKYQSLISASTEAEALQQLSNVASQYGYDSILLAAVPTPGQPLETAYLRSTYDTAWRETYDKRGFGAIDPTVSHCFSHSAPMVWSPDSFKTQDERALYEEASGYGLKAGVTLPFHGPGGEVGMLTLVRDELANQGFYESLRSSMSDLALLRDLAFEVLRPHIHAQTPAKQQPEAILPSLTSKEMEYLKWLTAGKTDWEISRIMGVSVAGARFHIANLRRKFDVSRRTDVVVRALQMGLVAL